jgi:tungstate transport system substrate-binding protein
MLRRYLAVLVACISACGLGVLATAAQAAKKPPRIELNVWGTSDITDSQLLSELLKPKFEAAFKQYGIEYTAAGSGAAINHAIEKENAPVLTERVNMIIVHSPSSEKPFWEGNHSVEPRGRSVWYNAYVVPGPLSDPAGVDPSDAHNAVAAFTKIYEAGAAGKAVFVSRNDESGTNTKEQEIWGQVHAANPTLEFHEITTKRFTPLEGGHAPAWYKETGATQGANLQITNTCAPTEGCYTMVDKGTYLWQSSHGETPNLKIVTQENEAAAPGGISELTNPFHAYIVKNAPNQAGAEDLMQFLTSDKFQEEVAKFPKAATEKSFTPDAFPGLLSSELPKSAPANSKITVKAAFVYLPPVAQPIEGMEVKLLQSVGCTKTYTAVAGVAGQLTHVIDSQPGAVEFTEVPFGSTKTCYAVENPNYSDTATAIETLFTQHVNTALGASGNGQVKPSNK